MTYFSLFYPLKFFLFDLFAASILLFCVVHTMYDVHSTGPLEQIGLSSCLQSNLLLIFSIQSSYFLFDWPDLKMCDVVWEYFRNTCVNQEYSCNLSNSKWNKMAMSMIRMKKVIIFLLQYWKLGKDQSSYVPAALHSIYTTKSRKDI